MKSEFVEWFVAQHKPRTDSGMPKHTDQQLRDMVQAGRVAERVLACRELWDEKQLSALYAWQARERRLTPEFTGLRQEKDDGTSSRSEPEPAGVRLT